MATEEDEGPLKIEDTNMDGYGGEEHRAKQKAIAEKMPEWKGAGEKEGIRVWRIEKFEVKDWPQEEYGTFYGGDSFIILHSFKENPESEALAHNVHFWLGEKTSQDEAGAAAFKTVELDDKLGDLPKQYRQVQGHETKEFTMIFPNMNVLEGGVDSGFRHVEPTEYQPRLFHVFKKGKKKKGVQTKQIDLTVENLNNNDCFILDAGLTLFQFYPPRASFWEKRGALTKCNAIDQERNGKCTKHVLDWNDEMDVEKWSPEEREFWEHFDGGKPESLPNTSAYEEKKQKEEEALANHVNCMYHITDEDGKVKATKVAEGVLDQSILANEDDDVVLVDVGRIIYVWIGSTANRTEKTYAMKRAQDFLMDNKDRPAHTPIQRIFSGREPEDFKKCFGVEHVSADICN